MPIFHNDVWYNNDGTPMSSGGDGAVILASSAIPISIPANALTISATGLISGIKAGPGTQPSGVVKVYIFAQPGLAEGVYYAIWGSGNSLQLYTNAAGTITPTGITPGTYNGNPGSATSILVSLPVPANSLGLNGILTVTANWSMMYDSSMSRSTIITLNGVVLATAGNQSLSNSSQAVTMQNRANLMSQWVVVGSVASTYGASALGSGTTTVNVDTSAPMTLRIIGKSGNNSSWMSLDSYSVSYTAIN